MTILKNLLRLLLKKEAASAASILISTDFFDYPYFVKSVCKYLRFDVKFDTNY